jgi:hypothetical protein
MRKKQELNPTVTELATQPFFYEIRIKGRLSEEQWTAWFSNLAVSTKKGETILQGTLPDHAALYGLLARLRDLAVPLLAVKVLDAEAQYKLSKQSRRYTLYINLVLLVIYLMLVGGLVAITTFLTGDGILHTALALAMLFASLGVLAYAFALWSNLKTWWNWLAYGAWGGSVLTFLIYTAVGKLLHPAISIALILFICAGGLIYLLSYLRNRAEKVDSVITTWTSLGNGAEASDPRRLEEAIKRDVPQQ